MGEGLRSRLAAWLVRLRGPVMPVDPLPYRLVDCRRCGADFVVPVMWRECRDGGLSMRLRCGACGDTRDRTVTDAEARRFDADLDAGAAELTAALAGLEREHMLCDAQTLAEAFARDLIDPSDFRR